MSGGRHRGTAALLRNSLHKEATAKIPIVFLVGVDQSQLSLRRQPQPALAASHGVSISMSTWRKRLSPARIGAHSGPSRTDSQPTNTVYTRAGNQRSAGCSSLSGLQLPVLMRAMKVRSARTCDYASERGLATLVLSHDQFSNGRRVSTRGFGGALCYPSHRRRGVVEAGASSELRPHLADFES